MRMMYGIGIGCTSFGIIVVVALIRRIDTISPSPSW